MPYNEQMVRMTLPECYTVVYRLHGPSGTPNILVPVLDQFWIVSKLGLEILETSTKNIDLMWRVFAFT